MAENTAASWNVLSDLQFLLQTDDDRDDEILHMHELPLDSTTLVDGVCSSPPEKKRRVRDYHHRGELAQLRKQVEDLKSTLREAKTKTGVLDTSIWQKAARRERVEKMRSIQENVDLRAAVDERAAYIDQMKRTLSRKPRWSTMPEASVEEWQSFKLAAQQSRRTSAIHAIADRQYRRQPNAFIQAGIYDRSEDLFRAAAVTLPSRQVLLQVINHVNLSAPASIIALACWRAFRRDYPPIPIPENACETIERIDEHTIYERFSHTRGGVTGHSNNIRKYYAEDGRYVTVWRTVLEDALVPEMAQGAVENSWGWMVVTPHPRERSKSRMTCLVQTPVDPRTFAGPTNTTASPNRFEVQSIEAIKFAITTTFPFDADFTCPPAMRTFVERGQLFERAIKSSLNDAIARFASEGQKRAE
ncbi:unnamed protein product [Aphanomyces euteiches]